MREDRSDAFLRMIRRAQHGRLKVYLGYCAGVGKTYQMLQEGRRLREEGIDVVIGLLETHGRSDVAKLAEGLEVVPRRRQEYRGVPVEEMDLAAVLARRPQVALIDELAHANVPGSPNPKRYQDVEDILAAGIHVITTLNVQHLESLYDTVEKAVGVKVRERLPDSVLAEADEIVAVDLTPEDLQKRLEEGKIYPRERIETALANFFVVSNLEKLRELALRELASQIDLRRRDTTEEDPGGATEQVLVCLSSRGPNSEKLLRFASRLAGKLNRNWYALYVQTRAEDAATIDAATQRELSGTLTLAKQLGATVFTYRGEDVADTIVKFAGEYRVAHIIVGRPSPRPFWKKLRPRRDVVANLIRQARGVSVIVLDTREGGAWPARPLVEVPEGMASRSASPRVSSAPATYPLSWGRLLRPSRIAVWVQSVPRDEVLRTLAEKIGRDIGGVDPEAIFRDVLAREEQASTFFNEGAAFPHVRSPFVGEPVVAVGLTKNGVSDARTDKPVEVIVLIVAPVGTPESMVQVLALASRAVQSHHVLQLLRSARTPADVMNAFSEWEASRP